MTETTAPPPTRVTRLERRSPLLEVVIPVYNEEASLAGSVRRVHAFVRRELPFDVRITVADNASTDRTEEIGRGLADDLPGVAYLRLAQKGRGRALRTAWLASDATVVAYMDVDLSTDLSALLPLVAPLLTGHSELAIGTRLHRDSHVVRGPKREFISRCYNRLLRTLLRARFSDAQCGFKAIRRDTAGSLLPAVVDQEWFFDTELLVLAERMGLRVHEVPVDWTDDPDSRVDIVDTAAKDLRGMWRIRSARAQVAAVASATDQLVPTTIREAA
ncbi:glycosyltransferase family 2 protein [Nocardioides mangrovicus]|uniref:dolichyl-phosphate beta-glucosyltransferase n=1 Tax=Nocardioides mangrovicus TaxID=2478913 RepID=A0A3L8P6K0_9ACTN|nr:dolichyl-phosphate beta-glucosyltransferase [Nocardioides mangrovicus]RLV50577.1 glycosyltransferase family 2 protein [Nocardioides mangrovicus]